MTEEMPPTGLTLGKAKQWLADHFVKYTIKRVNAPLSFGLDQHHVEAMEEVSNINSIRKRNFKLWTQGLDNEAKAWWEATQGPMSAPAPTPAEPRFLDGTREFLRAEVKANRIKAGELIYGDDIMERATATVVDATSNEKHVVIKRVGVIFTMEDFTPIPK